MIYTIRNRKLKKKLKTNPEHALIADDGSSVAGLLPNGKILVITAPVGVNLNEQDDAYVNDYITSTLSS